MKKAYLAIGFQSRRSLQAEVDTIQEVLARSGISLFVFTDQYHFLKEAEKEMMQTAFREIRGADLFIAEVSEKAIGVGIETGYAAALLKPIVYLRNHHAEHSTTASGAATHSIIYSDTSDLSVKWSLLLDALINTIEKH